LVDYSDLLWPRHRGPADAESTRSAWALYPNALVRFVALWPSDAKLS
jgi:hypothetical protein